MFENLKIDSDIIQDNEDVIPQKRAFAIESGVYPLEIDLAYLDKSVGGATALKVVFKEHPFEGFKINQTYWVASGDTKGNKNYYVHKDGSRRLLPGMLAANHLSIITTGKSLGELVPEEKIIKLYSFEAKKEIPTKVQAVTELIGQVFKGGVLKKIENRRVRAADGSWGPGPVKREFNEVDKVFNEDGLTVAELKGGAKTPEFLKLWEDKYKDTVDDRYDDSIKGSDSSVVPDTAKETTQLFG